MEGLIQSEINPVTCTIEIENKLNKKKEYPWRDENKIKIRINSPLYTSPLFNPVKPVRKLHHTLAGQTSYRNTVTIRNPDV